jgi:hypothetical protein
VHRFAERVQGRELLQFNLGMLGSRGLVEDLELDLEREDLVAILQAARVTSIGDVHLVDLVSSSHILTTILTSPMTPKNLVSPQYLSSRQPLPSHLHRLRPRSNRC